MRRTRLCTLLLAVVGTIGASPLGASACPEVGVNDFRLSVLGGSGSAEFDAREPRAAYNPDRDEYLVVFWGDGGPNQANEIFEIYGQVHQGGGGFGTFLQISDMGPEHDTDYGAFTPDVAYDSTNEQYLVVWEGNDDAVDELRIYGQLLTGATIPIGGSFPISDAPDSLGPAVAYNPTDDEYLVTWLIGDEVVGQRLDAATGARIGDPEFRISGPGAQMSRPSVTYNPMTQEYLVVWVADILPALFELELEIVGQRLNGRFGLEVGVDDFRISAMGPDGDSAYDALNPSIAVSPEGRYLVVWQADTDFPTIDDEFEIFGQLLDGAGGSLGADDFLVSDMGGMRESLYDAGFPAATYDSAAEAFLVVWHGEDDVDGLAVGEREIFGQYLDRDGLELAPNDFRISDVVGTGGPSRDANRPAVAPPSDNGQLLVVWSADDDDQGAVDEEFEIYGQRVMLSGCEIFRDGFESGDTGAWGSP